MSRRTWDASTLQVGTRVRRVGITYDWEGMYQGEEYLISEIDKWGNMKVRGLSRWYHAIHFEVIS